MQIPHEPIGSETSRTTGSAGASSSGEWGQSQVGPSTVAGPSTPRTSTGSGETSTAQRPSSTSSHDEGAPLDAREFNAKYWFGENGRINIKVQGQLRRLDRGVLSQVSEETPLSQPTSRDEPPPYVESIDRTQLGDDAGLVLNVVMHVVGSVDEVSHFIAVGQLLTEYGHRVRIATHPEFRTEVAQAGVEFFDIGAAAGASDFFMSGAKILDPRSPAREEDVPVKHSVVRSVVNRLWKACIEPSPDGRIFIADAIIANPQSLAHVHCGERLGVPLHLMSTYANLYFILGLVLGNGTNTKTAYLITPPGRLHILL